MAEINKKRAIELAIIALIEYQRRRYAFSAGLAKYGMYEGLPAGMKKDVERYDEINEAIKKLKELV